MVTFFSVSRCTWMAISACQNMSNHWGTTFHGLGVRPQGAHKHRQSLNFFETNIMPHKHAIIVKTICCAWAVQILSNARKFACAIYRVRTKSI
jgi:hypothetical protein